MAETKPTCALLLISQDMEWMNAFQKGVNRFFLSTEKVIDSLEATETQLLNFSPDLIVLSADSQMPEMDKLKQLLYRLGKNIPVLVIKSDSTEPSDTYVKQGAEFVCARRDLLSAIRAVQHIMRLAGNEDQMSDTQTHMEALAMRYERLFADLPDPLCYLQDGLFLSANPAFLKVFKVKDEQALNELTFMNFVPLKSERNIKQLMKMALEKDVVPAEKIELHNKEGEKLDMVVHVSRVQINGETAVQMYLRDAAASGGAGGGLDPTTGLGNATLLRASIRQTQERSESELLGTWVYLWLENYREVFQKDGYKPAEILIRAVVQAAERLLPPSTEMVRFCDDSILLWITGDKEQAITRIQNLVNYLDELVPENIGRLIHPYAFAGMLEVRKTSTFEELLSKSYRAVRGLAVSQSKERIAEPAAANMTRKDERRVNEITHMLDQQRIRFWYQPIVMLSNPDGISRYADKLEILPNPDTVEGLEEEIEVDTLLQLADRYGLGRRIDQVKFTQFCQDILSYDGDQRGLTGFLSVSADTLEDETFPEWLESLFNQTGISPAQIVFDLKVDTANNAYSGAKRLIDKMRPLKARFAISEIGRFDEEIKEILERIQPEVLKLDMQEIDTFEDDEEDRFMSAVKEYAQAHQTILIADRMESPAQLSRVWPHDIQYLQGDGMISAMEHFDFDFNEPLF
ncbi:EAL domain-containing protein [Suttonella ornithocola]|uniref:Putative diguanylate cyclase n=1 Tax=Suttonella ornithocola TaxID=279832 RepID=A0A380MYW9_9GAMM|nr:EAL domain-containing protein [Suttonella ornithocola]SUO97502.1 putative diguanylate cyclase [Suttonella ornithocola]